MYTVKNMVAILKPLLTAFLAFIAVNLDELVALIVFFSQVDGVKMTNADVVLGQLLGFTIIFGLSIIGIILGVFFDLEYVALIGFAPLLIGLFQLYKVGKYWFAILAKKYKRPPKGDLTRSFQSIFTSNNKFFVFADDHENILNENSLHGLDEHLDPGNNNAEVEYGPVPTHIERENSSHSSSSSDESNFGMAGDMLHKCASQYLRPSMVTVTVTIFADGSEEIGVFVPLFATASTSDVIVIIITFYILVLLQCLVAYQLVKCKYIGKFISRYSKNLMPFILIGLGLYILSESILAREIEK